MKLVYQQVDTARKKLQLMQEKLQVDQELLNQEKKNFKKRLRAAKLSQANQQIENENEIERLMEEHSEKMEEMRKKIISCKQENNEEVKALKDRIEHLEVLQSARENEHILKIGNFEEEISNSDNIIKQLRDELAQERELAQAREMELLDLQRNADTVSSNVPYVSECRNCMAMESELQQLSTMREKVGESRLEDIERKLENTRTQNSELASRCNHLEQQLQLKESENAKIVEELKQRYDRDAEIWLEKEKELNLRIKELELDNENIDNSSLEEARQRILFLEQEALVLKDQSANFNCEKCSTLEKELDYIRSNPSSQTPIDRSLPENMETVDLAEKIVELQNELNESEEMVAEKSKLLEDSEREKGKLQAELENLQSALKSSEDSVVSERKLNRDIRQKLSQLEVKLAERNLKLDCLQEENGTAKKDIMKKTSEIAKLTEQISSLNRQKKQLADSMESLKNASTSSPSSALNTSGRLALEEEWLGENLEGIFTGYLDENGQPNGSGTLRAEDGSVYDGEWKSGTRSGVGVFATIDGDVYRGDWFGDVYHGTGVLIWSDGRVYRGGWLHGKRHGKAIMTFPHGATYQGEYEEVSRNDSPINLGL